MTAPHSRRYRRAMTSGEEAYQEMLSELPTELLDETAFRKMQADDEQEIYNPPKPRRNILSKM